MATSRLAIARADIIKHFDRLPRKVFQLSDIAAELADQREFWRAAKKTTVAEFVRFLVATGRLTSHAFPFPLPYKKRTLYAWGEVPIHQVILGLKPGCYFSHYTAVQIHGLTEQSPTTIYVNDEQRLESWLAGKLSQSSIDAAFRRPVRVTSQVAQTADYRVVMINGKNTGKLGVIEEDRSGGLGAQFGKVRFTNIERTLIDIAVRPVYSGGVGEVLKAFELARDKVSVNRLAAMLKKLAYIYPYHQIIGFYLDRAGYKASVLDLLRSIPMEFDFYLVHEMKQTEFVRDWRLFIPKGF